MKHFQQKLVYSITCSMCENWDKKYWKKKESIEILIKIYNYFKNMVKGNISQKFRLRNIDKTRNYVVEEIEQKL